MADSTPSATYVKQAATLVTAALQLDSAGKYREAYCQYLNCMHHIVSILLEESKEPARKDFLDQSKKLLTLHKQCSERVNILLEEIAASAKSVDESLTHTELPTSPSPTLVVKWNPGPDDELTTLSMRDPTPLEQAQHYNKQLMVAYKARVTRIQQRGGREAPELGLTLQRKMAENMAVAHARQEALSRKMQERQRKMQEEAARRFASSTGMYKDEQERRQTYTKVMEFEQDRRGLQMCRKKMSTEPLDLAFTQRLIKQIIKTSDHPLTVVLVEYQQQALEKLKPLLSRHQEELKLALQLRAKSTSSDASSNFSNSLSDDNFMMTCKSMDKPSSDVKDFDRQHSLDIDDFDDLFDDTEEESAECGAQKNMSVDTGENGTVQEKNSSESEIEEQRDKCEENYEDRISVDGITETLEQLNRNALIRHARNVVLDLQDNLEKLQTMFVVAYEQLDNPVGRDLCYACLEEPFFSPLWPFLLTIFRLANEDEERRLMEVISHDELQPSDFRVDKKFCLDDTQSFSKSKLPYQTAVQELQQLFQLVGPLSKLECIVRVTRTVCLCVEEHYSAAGDGEQTPNVGADDLLPILCYVIAKCGQAQLVSELRALEELTHEGYLMGEEGYCLTSMQTALGYVLTLADS